MATTDPIRSQIIDDLITTLETISPANGYKRTVRKASRVATPITNPNRDMVYVRSADEQKEDLHNNKRDCTMTVMLAGVIEDRTNLALAIDEFAADVEKALYVDITRSTLAIDTRVVRVEEEVSEDFGAMAGCIMTLEIRYRHATGNPYSGV